MRRLALLLVVIAVLLPSSAAAQTPVDEDSVVIRINSDALVAEGERVQNLVVISANAVVDGTITGSLLVIDGNAVINGTVEDNTTVISGDVTLNDGATVNNVQVIRGDITRSPNATIRGDIEERDFTGLWGALGVLSVLLWIGITIAALAAGIVFAIIGGRQLTAAATLMTGEAVNAIVGTVFVWVGLPILAVLAIITVIGLPLGLGILIFLMPVLGFLGYLVAATRVGTFLTNAMNRPETDRPIISAIIGVLLLQVLLIVPVIGGVLVFLASIWGAGALAFIAYRGAGGRDVSPPATT